MEQTTLLMLDDRCLIEIVKLLPLTDVIKLAKTCTRLKNIAVSALTDDYRKTVVNILVILTKEPQYGSSSRTKHELLSLIGKIVDSLTLKLIQNGVNERFLRDDRVKPFIYKILNKVPNLKELKVMDKDIKTEDLTEYFSNNNQLESLECWHDVGVFKLLQMLPKLTTLRIHNVPSIFYHNETFGDLISLKQLTTFSFSSFDRYNNCNGLLSRIASELDLLELDIKASVNDHTFHLINSFKNLKSLSIVEHEDNFFPTPIVPENLVLPQEINCLKLGGFILSGKSFVFIVKNLKLLKKFDIGNCFIYLRDKEVEIFPHNTPYCPNYKKFITFVGNELRDEIILNGRTFVLSYFNVYTGLTYECSHFEIINRVIRLHGPIIKQPDHLFLKCKLLDYRA